MDHTKLNNLKYSMLNPESTQSNAKILFAVNDFENTSLKSLNQI